MKDMLTGLDELGAMVYVCRSVFFYLNRRTLGICLVLSNLCKSERQKAVKGDKHLLNLPVTHLYVLVTCNFLFKQPFDLNSNLNRYSKIKHV